MRLTSRKALQYFLVACSVVLVGYIGFGMVESTERSRPLPFEAETWRESYLTASEGFVRFRMVEDLQREHLRLGMTRSDVEALLGPGQEPGAERRDTIRYSLRTGTTSDFELGWEDVLTVVFDSSGLVTSHGVERLE